MDSHLDLSSNFTRSRTFSLKLDTPTPLNSSSFKHQDMLLADLDTMTFSPCKYEFEIPVTTQLKPSTQQSSRSNRTLFSNISNLNPNLKRASNTTALAASSNHLVSLSLPKLLRQAGGGGSTSMSTATMHLTNPSLLNMTSQSGSNNLSLSLEESSKQQQQQSRRVSFGQVELNQLEIPIVYKHSNVALERYKLNPNFYLPGMFVFTRDD